METYFIRHTWNKVSVDDKTRKRMWRERRVFIHFPWDKTRNQHYDSRSKNPEGYEVGNKRALSALQRLATEGGYVCAHYSEQDKWLMGFVPPKSKVRLFRGRWTPEDRPKGHNGVAIIKTVRLHKACLVSPHDYASLQSAQPRQGTIMRWPSVGDLVAAIVRKERRQVTFDRLGASDQEVMCAEFLRLGKMRQDILPKLVCLLRDVGRTMKDLDVLGIASDGKRIMAQVTYDPLETSGARKKLDKLKKYQSNRGVHLLLFCDSKKRSRIGGVSVFPIREVYERFCRTPVGKLWKKQFST